MKKILLTAVAVAGMGSVMAMDKAKQAGSAVLDYFLARPERQQQAAAREQYNTSVRTMQEQMLEQRENSSAGRQARAKNTLFATAARCRIFNLRRTLQERPEDLPFTLTGVKGASVSYLREARQDLEKINNIRTATQNGDVYLNADLELEKDIVENATAFNEAVMKITPENLTGAEIQNLELLMQAREKLDERASKLPTQAPAAVGDQPQKPGFIPANVIGARRIAGTAGRLATWAIGLQQMADAKSLLNRKLISKIKNKATRISARIAIPLAAIFLGDLLFAKIAGQPSAVEMPIRLARRTTTEGREPIA